MANGTLLAQVDGYVEAMTAASAKTKGARVTITICCSVCDKPTISAPSLEWLDAAGVVSALCGEHTEQ